MATTKPNAVKPKPTKHASAADTKAAVDAFMGECAHPYRALIESIRATILDADPSIEEGIKWNSPSFRTSEYFATTNLRTKTGVGLILHLGAKTRALPDGGIVIADPTGLLKWLARDRAAVEFANAEDFALRKAAFVAVIRDWIGKV